MNAQHKINKRNARLRRIQKRIDWLTTGDKNEHFTIEVNRLKQLIEGKDETKDKALVD